MKGSKDSIKKVTVFIIIIFALLIGTTVKISVIDSEKMIVNAYNPRINQANSSIKRGSIKDIDGYEFVYSEKEGDTYKRVYNDVQSSAHVVGYVNPGKSGIEASGNFTLEHVSNEFIQRLSAFFTDEDVEGDSIYLTIDKDLQDIASNLMRTNKGAVVVEEISTGRILTMVSKPDFDPSTISDNWESVNNNEDSPLLNRAVSGEYTPGSIFKIITTVSAIRNMDDIDSLSFECDSDAEYEDKVIHCFNNKAHGTQNIVQAFANSCNTAYSLLGYKLGGEALRQTADELLFNEPFEFLLGTATPKMSLTESSSVSEIVETAIGQGKTTVTPLYMVSLVSAIANNGIMMKPYIIDHVESYSGNTVSRTVPESYATLFTAEECEKLKEMMIAVVNEGTGYNANSEYFQVAGKTGTAENPGGNDHLWFVGFAPADSPQYAVSVVLENGDGSANASVIARKMLYNAINRDELN
jgi:peptidoglycan glycosyltransferase